MTKKRQWINMILHTVFWVITTYWFSRNSFLRPWSTTYKEILCAVFIAAVIYLNYFILIPQFYNKRKRILYFILTFSSLFLSVSGEFLLVKNSVKQCINSIITPELMSEYYLTMYWLITLRNLGFLCFFILLRLYQLETYNIALEKQSIARSANILSIMPNSNTVINLNINKICYFKSKKNAVEILLTNKHRFQQFISLSDIENIIPKRLYISINRSCIVILKNIIGYTDTGVFVRLNKQFIPYYQTKQQALKDKLMNWNPALYNIIEDNYSTTHEATPSNEDVKNISKNIGFGKEKSSLQDEFWQNGGEKLSVLEENSKLKALYDYIKMHPNCKTFELSKGLKISERNIQRMVKILREAHLIMHVGSRGKKSGFIVIDK